MPALQYLSISEYEGGVLQCVCDDRVEHSFHLLGGGMNSMALLQALAATATKIIHSTLQLCPTSC